MIMVMLQSLWGILLGALSWFYGALEVVAVFVVMVRLVRLIMSLIGTNYYATSLKETKGGLKATIS